LRFSERGRTWANGWAMNGHWMTKQARALRAFAQRFADSSRGNVAMIFAITLPILVMITMGGVDISRASTVKSNLQDALDAATLAAARTSFVTDKDLTTAGTAALNANLAAYPGISVTSATFTMSNERVVIANATVSVKTLVAAIVLPPYGKLMDDKILVGAHSEVNRSSKNIEVALVLDITGSMGCGDPDDACPASGRIESLKAAARQLVDIVVQDVQTPYYTKMSIIPYSTGVNLGSAAAAARGAATQSTPITNVRWTSDTGKTITAISKANPAVVTISNHGYATGDVIGITGVGGMTQMNGKAYLVDRVNASSFRLKTLAGAAVSSSGYSTYSSGGRVQLCLVDSCNLVITSANHGLLTTDAATNTPATVRISDVVGVSIGSTSQLNNKSFEIADVESDTFSVGVLGPSVTAYSSGGKAWCGRDGCQWRVYRNASSGALKTYEISTCATERVGSARYTDASPASAFVGRSYPNPTVGNDTACPRSSNTLQPLTAVKKDLTTLINALKPDGYTAGQIGLAWGWYTVSPSFNALWSSNTAGAYVPRDTLKAVILMTDGEFNANYCSGVLASNAGFGGVERIACAASNGDPFAQATALCSAMKGQQIVVYTVGFAVTKGTNAANILKNCATGPEYAFLPASGADLKEDFAAIGRDITRLRISK